MKPIRVLHILHSMNRGGAENSIMNYYRHIDRDKVQFDFLLTVHDESLFEKEINVLGGRVYRIPLLTFSNPFRYLSAIRRFFKGHPEYKIVHSHTSSKSFFPLAVAKCCHIPARICHSHGSQSEKGINGKVRDALKFPLKLVATNYLACGESAACWLYGQSFNDNGRVSIFPNVIESERFDINPDIRSFIRNKLDIAEDTVVIGSTSRFSRVKNPGFLISCFSQFNMLYPNSKLLLVGDGELRKEIENQLCSLGLQNDVLLTGVVANVNDYLQAMDFFMMPSINEGLPLSLIEAQISGLHCFVSKGVPKEADLTGLVSFLSLDDGPYYWANCIYDSIGYERKSRIVDIINAGYDAATSARKLESFYIDIFNSF